MIEYGIVTILILGLILTRNIHVFTLPGVAKDADGYVHMVIAREFRENDHHVPEYISASVFDWTFSYPHLIHFILSFFPERYYPALDRVFPTIMDILYLGIFVTLIRIGFLDFQDLPIVLALFVSTPQFVQYAGGKGLSARKPGVILGTLSLLSFVVWSTSGINWILLVSIIFGGLTHLTSRFGTQAIIFFYLGFALFNPIAILVAASSFIVAIVLSRGKYIEILCTHLRFSYDYAIRKQFVFLYNGFKSTDTLRRFFKARKPSEVLAAVYESILLKALLNNPYAIGVAIVLLWSHSTSAISVPTELIVWFGTGLVACVLTTVYGLRFLGQPGRYLNYSFVPGSLIIIDGFEILPFDGYLFLISLLFLGFVMLAGQALAYKRLAPDLEKLQAFDEAIEYLKTKDVGRILTQPRHLGAEIAWKSPNSSVSDFFGDWWSTKSSNETIKEVFIEDPIITGNTDILEQSMNPSWVIFNKESLSEIGEGCLSPPHTRPKFENQYYSIYHWDSFTS